MDNFFRIEKPVSTKPPHPKSAARPTPRNPQLKEWSDVVSEQAASIDLSVLSTGEMENVLRLFDLNPTYGPFVGVDRSFRWQRAQACGLHPPQLIKRILDSGRVHEQREAGRLW